MNYLNEMPTAHDKFQVSGPFQGTVSGCVFSMPSSGFNMYSIVCMFPKLRDRNFS